MPLFGILIVAWDKNEDDPVNDSVIDVIKVAMEAGQWHNMAFSLDLRSINRQRIINILHPKIDFSESILESPPLTWWKWPSGPTDDAKAPIWWRSPEMVVVRLFIVALHNTDSPLNE